jgi:hypothetical protein
LLTLVIGAAVVLTLAVLGTNDLGPDLGGIQGLVFWTVVVALSSAAPVRMPGGALVDVTIAPILAVGALGGPAAAAVVVLIGTLDAREVRGLIPGLAGGIPWYGTLYNRASIVIPAVLAAMIFRFLGGGMVAATAGTLAAVVVAGMAYFVVNNVLAALVIAFKQDRAPQAVFRANLRQFGIGLAGLTPVAWLMAAMYIVAGPIGILPFAVPLFATRSGYQKVVEIRDMFTQTVRSLASAVDAKDPYTAGHSERVQLIARSLGEELACSDSELEALEWGGLLHDIGKIGIPDAILLKQGALTREERTVMNLHPVKGEEIIKPVIKLAPELPIIRHHHEWYNGSGYPDKLIGEQIPRLARIMHVADSFEAMTSARPYRMTPLTEQQALEELRRFTNVQFDPEVVAAFEKLIVKRPAWSRPEMPQHLPHADIPMLGEQGQPGQQGQKSTGPRTA